MENYVRLNIMAIVKNHLRNRKILRTHLDSVNRERLEAAPDELAPAEILEGNQVHNRERGDGGGVHLRQIGTGVIFSDRE